MMRTLAPTSRLIAPMLEGPTTFGAISLGRCDRARPFGADDVQGWPGMPPGVLPPAEPTSPGSALVPGGYQPGRQLDLSGWPSTNREPTPRGGGFGVSSDSSLGRHQQLQSLGPGAALKGGRYLLVQPFQAAPQLRPQGGEPPLMLATSVFAAIADAVHSVRPGEPVMLDAPATPESILKAVGTFDAAAALATGHGIKAG